MKKEKKKKTKIQQCKFICLTSRTQLWIPMGLDGFTSVALPFVTHTVCLVGSCLLFIPAAVVGCHTLVLASLQLSSLTLIKVDIFNNDFPAQCQASAVLHNPFNPAALMLPNSMLYGRLLHTTKFSCHFERQPWFFLDYILYVLTLQITSQNILPRWY